LFFLPVSFFFFFVLFVPSFLSWPSVSLFFLSFSFPIYYFHQIHREGGVRGRKTEKEEGMRELTTVRAAAGYGQVSGSFMFFLLQEEQRVAESFYNFFFSFLSVLLVGTEKRWRGFLLKWKRNRKREMQRKEEHPLVLLHYKGGEKVCREFLH
jgi:hypothetical protein